MEMKMLFETIAPKVKKTLVDELEPEKNASTEAAICDECFDSRRFSEDDVHKFVHKWGKCPFCGTTLLTEEDEADHQC